MKHKFLIVLLAIATALGMAFGLAGCGDKELDDTGKNPPITDPSGDQGSGSGEMKKPYTKNADGTISFGKYPQTEVKDSGLKNALTSQAGTLPTEENAGSWQDYGYYLEGSVQSYMWYQDVSYGGEKYRGVYFTSDSHRGGYGYQPNTVYWFKYDPIEWRVLEQKNGTAFLMANIILDSQQYYHEYSGTRTINGKTIYPNNYAESEIRAWLRETFYETAFDEDAKSLIETTEVDNSAASTSADPNPYVCENTQDKVFLLSHEEVLNTSYGFTDTTRQLKSTDYAKSQGIVVFSDYACGSPWWLRSPHYYSSGAVRFVNVAGDVYNSQAVYSTYLGVVPALRLRLS